MPNEDRRRLAQLRLRARRARDGELRRRAIFLSLNLFALLWVAVFAIGFLVIPAVFAIALRRREPN
jgi:hypothetical protein